VLNFVFLTRKKLVLPVLLLCVGFWFGTPAKAHAMTLIPDPGSSIPASIRSYLASCNTASPLQSPAFAQWVSLAGNPNAMNITVPRGTAFVDLQHNYASAICSSRNAVDHAQVKVIGSGPFGVSGINGTIMDFIYNPSNKLGLYVYAKSGTFRYTFPSPVTTSQTVTITLATITMNHFTRGGLHYVCVGGPAGDHSFFDFSACKTDFPSFDIQVDVPPNNPPTGSITASCTLVGATPMVNFSIATSDPEGDPVSITSLSVGGVAQSVGTRSVAVGFGASGSVVAVITDGINAGVTLAASYVCPTNRPPTGTVAVDCVNITGTAVDPDWSGALTVNILIDGFNVTGGGLTASPPGRTYSYRIATGYLDNNVHTVVVQASDFTGSGALVGFVTVANTSFRCGIPGGTVNISCSIEGNVIDPSSPLTKLFVDATIDGRVFPNVGYTDPLDSGKLHDATTGDDRISLLAFLSDFNTHSVIVTVKGVSPSGVPDGGNGVWGPVTVGPCAPTCDSNVTLPLDPQANQSFTLSSLKWHYTQNAAAGTPINNWGGYTISVSAPGIPFANGAIQSLVDFPTVANAGTGNLRSGATVGPMSAAAPGAYQLIMRIAGPQFTLICDSNAVGRTVTGSHVPFTITEQWNPIKITNKPYIKTFGNDVSAGGGFLNASHACVAPVSRGILAWAQSNGGTGWTGSSVEYAAFAIDTIDGVTGGYGYYSGSQSHSGGSATPYGAYTTFANTGVTLLGGKFDNPNGHCIPDYYDSTRLTSVAPTLLNSVVSRDVCSDPAIVNGTQYVTTGSLILNGCSNFNKRVTIYVPGDTIVRGNISYAPYSVSMASNTTPYLTIVSLGNIYISAGVTNIDGLYIAQPNGATGGTIHTCTNDGALYPHATLYDSCKTQLKINGSLIAKYIAMERTFGTVASASSSESATSSSASEVTIQGPETFIGTPLFKPTTSSIFEGKPSFQSITSLSPLF
jgi:hypothetical protein